MVKVFAPICNAIHHTIRFATRLREEFLEVRGRLYTLLYKMPSNLEGKNFVSKFPGYCPHNTMAFFHQN